MDVCFEGWPHSQVDGRCGDRCRRSARLPVFRQLVICWALSMAPKTQVAQSPSRPPRSVTRIEISAGSCYARRSMCTIWPRGNPSRSPSRARDRPASLTTRTSTTTRSQPIHSAHDDDGTERKIVRLQHAVRQSAAASTALTSSDIHANDRADAASGARKRNQDSLCLVVTV